MAGNKSSKRPNTKSKKRHFKLSDAVIVAVIGMIGTVIVAIITIIPQVQKNTPSDEITQSSVTETESPTMTIAQSPAPTATDLLPTNTPQLTPLSTEPINVDSALPLEIEDSKGVSMVLVDKGEFKMGSDEDRIDESPVHKVILSAYYIDKYEVTNGLYKACVDAAICQPLKNNSSATRSIYYSTSKFSNYPIVYVDWDMANVYCKWRGARLPTESEWEKAARGTSNYTFPWGDVINCNYANYSSCTGDTTEVGIYDIGKSMYGVYDMAGNVWEWVNDWYSKDYYQISSPSDPLGPSSGKSKVLRGGSWNNQNTEVRSAIRYAQDPANFNYYFGFRCAKDATP